MVTNPSDPIVNNVLQAYQRRSRQGMQTYGVSMYENRAPFLSWLQHLQEELMDATLYAERAKIGFQEWVSDDLDLDLYQSRASETAVFPPEQKVMYPALGLAGEAGEVCNRVKKIFRDDDGVVDPEVRRKLAAELGDVLWYLAALATDLDLNLAEIAHANLAKLADRQARGKIQGNGDER